MGLFFLHVDFTLVDQEKRENTLQIVPNAPIKGVGPDLGRLYDAAPVVKIPAGGTDLRLPARDCSPYEFGFTITRSIGGHVDTWNVPTQNPGVTVNLSDFTPSNALPMSASEFAQVNVALTAEIDRATTAEEAIEVELAAHSEDTTNIHGISDTAQLETHTGAQAKADAAKAFAIQRGNHTGTQPAASISDLGEAVQDVVGAMLVSGGTLTLSYDDAAGTVTITGTGADAEVVRDTIGAAIVGVNGVTVAINDAADTITLGVTGLTIGQVTGLQAAIDGIRNLTDSTLLTNLSASIAAQVAPAQAAANAAVGLAIVLGA